MSPQQQFSLVTARFLCSFLPITGQSMSTQLGVFALKGPSRFDSLDVTGPISLSKPQSL